MDLHPHKANPQKRRIVYSQLGELRAETQTLGLDSYCISNQDVQSYIQF